MDERAEPAANRRHRRDPEGTRMKKRDGMTVAALATLLLAAPMLAQNGVPVGRGRTAADMARPEPDLRWRTAGADRAAVDRGKAAFAGCGACHGLDARGGTGLTDVDLLRSHLVLQDDRQGTGLKAFLQNEHPTNGLAAVMSALDDRALTDITEWLHYQVAVASERGAYKPLDILTGDAKAGEAYFNGAGRCSTCHSPTGDLKGIAARLEPMALQNAIVTGIGGRGGRGRGGRAGRGRAAAGGRGTAKTARVTLASGETITGTLENDDPFMISVRLPDGRMRTIYKDFRTGASPRIVIEDPLQAHLDLLQKYTDDDIHNLTAYLWTLK
jgi:mono/diheme cytochrome c family protein